MKRATGNGMEMPIQGRTRKALDKTAAKFAGYGCTILWDTLKTIEVEE